MNVQVTALLVPIRKKDVVVVVVVGCLHLHS